MHFLKIALLLPLAIVAAQTTTDEQTADEGGACVVSVSHGEDITYCGVKTFNDHQCADLQSQLHDEPQRFPIYSCQLGAVTEKSEEEIEDICNSNNGTIVPSEDRAEYVKTGECGSPYA
ncbi:uncharacterized protein EURHEDRAFT_416526 [Aspergillus ruber CBS 135680]|uniref:Uncharacterized protein n=1 Tax=Aspergillus ruber (strain CBS 135680) TaxID=1388766 RepID=A0A017S2K4_ASPRC|nr:uncharacterized protein EURHEDRAFT_416526 [Aspergillus ruber CBS 135680]EYE91273.1 hypothetical protein EURHEDRAFT_416526 [Aspergillus ruber CBS 135680]